jgi:alpha-beta hydrolase superfamily lysophospholipase
MVAGLPARTIRALLRWTRRAVVAVLALLAAVVAGYSLYATTALPALAPWHTTIIPGEFTAGTDGIADFAGYQRLEAELFAAAVTEAAGWGDEGTDYTYSRFNAAGNLQRLASGAAFNRSFRLTPAAPVGSALLVHGLTDSPYSVKALAEALYAGGFEVTVLRLPGHGLWPAMLTRVDSDDWAAAVRLVAADVAARTPAGRPYYVGGYSTGATLVLSHALDTLADPALRRPDRVLLLSPAIELPRLAPVANLLDLLAVLPVDVVQKVRWQSVLPEYDPYKYNSFPINGTRQVNRTVGALRTRLDAAAAAGRLGQLPPVIAWQSVVDATVGATGTIDRLFARLDGAQHRLVLFDTDRHPRWNLIASPAPQALVARATAGPRGYTLELVSNAGDGAAAVSLRRYRPGATAPAVVPTGLAWPEDTVSVSHVALPFRPDDPVYGFLPGSGVNGGPTLGSLLLRGEAGATIIALGSLTRLRSNPFWGLVERQVGELVAADVGVPATPP